MIDLPNQINDVILAKGHRLICLANHGSVPGRILNSFSL